MSFRIRSVKVRDSVFLIEKRDANLVSMTRYESHTIAEKWDDISQKMANDLMIRHHDERETHYEY